MFRPLKIWRVNIGWYLVALLYQPLLFFFARWIDTLFGNTYEVVSPLTTVEGPIFFVGLAVVISAIPGAFMEELGWRGFALPCLQIKNNSLIASVILGLLWGAWSNGTNQDRAVRVTNGPGAWVPRLSRWH